jgi:hypothetical protein
VAEALGAGRDEVETDAAGFGDVDRWSGFAGSEVATVVPAGRLKRFLEKVETFFV